PTVGYADPIAPGKPAPAAAKGKTTKKPGKRLRPGKRFKRPKGKAKGDSSARSRASLGALGIAQGDQHRLTELGITTVGALARAPEARLTPAFGADKGKALKAQAEAYLREGPRATKRDAKKNEGRRGRTAAPAPDLRR
ncbi:MAG: hypothetical protein KC583_21100, partial [Myxococcales bacterium]|nr:hypothetical protein [Myxococcales bacterium]